MNQITDEKKKQEIKKTLEKIKQDDIFDFMESQKKLKDE